MEFIYFVLYFNIIVYAQRLCGYHGQLPKIQIAEQIPNHSTRGENDLIRGADLRPK